MIFILPFQIVLFFTFPGFTLFLGKKILVIFESVISASLNFFFIFFYGIRIEK